MKQIEYQLGLEGDFFFFFKLSFTARFKILSISRDALFINMIIYFRNILVQLFEDKKLPLSNMYNINLK